MRKVMNLMVVLALLVAFGVVLDIQFASATPDQSGGNGTADCLVCHKGNPTGNDAEGNATRLYMAFHDSQVGECMTCHAVDNESIHGEWNDTPESCARCHRTHSAVEGKLLVMGKDELCEFCHGHEAGLAQTNVLDGVLRDTQMPLRGGGFEQARMNTSAYGNLSVVGYPTDTATMWNFPAGNTTPLEDVTSTHTLDVAAVIWGEGAISATPRAGGAASTTLECVSCHDPHIFGLTYRMLRNNPTGANTTSSTRVFVTDQLNFKKFGGNTTILSYTTGDYSNTLIGSKTWDVGNDTWQVTPIASTSYAAPKVYKGNGTVEKVYFDEKGNGTWTSKDMYSDQLILWCSSCHDRYNTPKNVASPVDSGDAIYAYRHRTGDLAVVWNGNTTRYEPSAGPGSGTYSTRNVSYNCLVCHTAHGTTAFMTPMVQAEPWPGQGGGAYDTLGNGTRLGEGWLEKDTSLSGGNFTDQDGDSRSNLLRLDNRGVCQRCHQKGKTSYLTGTGH